MYFANSEDPDELLHTAVSSCSTLFSKTKRIYREKHFILEFIACDPSICIMDYPKFNVSNQKEESVRS